MLQPALLKAYQDTDYHVFGEARLVLQPGLFTSDANRFLRDQGCETAIILTAWNPMSVATAVSANEAAQTRLIEDLDQRGLVHIPAEGRGRDGHWPPEPSLLILGVPLHLAHNLAAAYQQAAFLFLRRDTAPEVIVTEV